ncbi:hypothetical protein LTR10_005310 [Elasticomyces elasticus]|nr:hypothetical protein LTR10_005310 [Elasticomyces elasticus]KAK4976046.1 hypothetical protein LTR42_003671 [Elasticomyces elasticus]
MPGDSGVDSPRVVTFRKVDSGHSLASSADRQQDQHSKNRPGRGYYHRVLIIDCEDESIEIRPYRDLPDSSKLRMLCPNIPRARKRIPWFVGHSPDPKLCLSKDAPGDARFWTEVRLDRMGPMDSLWRLMGGKPDLYVQNEDHLSDGEQGYDRC